MTELTEEEIGQLTYSMMLIYKGHIISTNHIPTSQQIQDIIANLQSMMTDYDNQELEATARSILRID